MSKDKTILKKNNTKKRSVVKIPLAEFPPLIADKEAFNALQNNHRKSLYEKVNKHFKPAKNTSTIKNWYLYPEFDMPVNNKDYIVAVMVHALTEVLNDIVVEVKIERANLDAIIDKYNKYLISYGQTA